MGSRFDPILIANKLNTSHPSRWLFYAPTQMQPTSIDTAVLAQIQMHKAVGISLKQIIDNLGETVNRVRHAIERMRQKDKIKHGYRDYKAVLWIPYDAPVLDKKPEPKKAESNAHIHRAKTGLTQPKNGPGHSKKPDPILDRPVFIPHKNGTTTSVWVPPVWEPARPQAADASRIPSRVGDELIPASAPKSMCVGRGYLQFAPSRLQP